MKMVIAKKIALVFGGIVVLGAAGSANAQDVLYYGTTTLSSPGLPVSPTCGIVLDGSISNTGNVVVESAGVINDGTMCDDIYLKNFNWSGSISPNSMGGALTLNTPSASIKGFGTVCQGTLSGITAGSYSKGPNGNNPTPESFNISGSSNFGNCSVNGDLVRIYPEEQ